MKAAFADALASVRKLVDEGAPVDDVLHSHTASVDRIIVDAFDGALAASGQTRTAGIALVALGGYGRRELAPASDLDLLLVHRGWTGADVAAVNRALTYPLWDAGRDVGARVREPKDVVRILGRADEAAALLDARLLAGDEGLFSEVREDVVRRLERGRASFFAQLGHATAERHARFGPTGHLLEPNIRDGAGGLRDVHTVAWASKLLPGAEGLDGLVASGVLSQIDADLLAAARRFLLDARVRLHLLTGRHQDQLYLADQDAIATEMGFEAQDGRPVADALMQDLYVHARNVDAVTASFWDRVTRRPRRGWRGASSRTVGDGCVVREGHLEVVAVTSPADDPAAWLRVFLRAIREGAPIGRASLNRLQSTVGPGALQWSAEARDVFTEIIQAGDAATSVLEAMDAAGFLEALIPEWAGVRCLPQRDLYHRFTVDMHLFATVAELAASRTSDELLVRDAWLNVSDARPLFVAALLHDIGKGRGGNHSEIGTRMAADVAARMRLGPGQGTDVAFLVQHHLDLASLATRRDLGEPRTIEAAVEVVGTTKRLAMLYLLTRADSKSTGPEAWSTFRAALVGELYTKTLRALEGRPAEDVDASPPREASMLDEPLAEGEVRTAVASRDDAHELVLASRDRPGLFATVCGVLALRSVDVHGAEVYTRDDGIAVEIFRVTGSHGEVPAERWERIARDVTAALAGDLDLDEALARKAGQERHRRPVFHRATEARVVIDNDASPTHTVVEVHAPDHLGLLREITSALYRSGCDVSVAKIATYGADVVDVFYVRDLDGTKITDAGRLNGIEEALRSSAR